VKLDMALTTNIISLAIMVLALPFLWAAVDDEMEAYMPAPIRKKE
jgi:hypothetical protein